MEHPVEKLVACLEPLLADAKLRAELGAYGREFAIANFGLPAMSERLAEIYARSMQHYGFRVWLLDFPGEITSMLSHSWARIRSVWSCRQGLGARRTVQAIDAWGEK